MPDIRTKTADGAPGDSGAITGYASTWTREPDSWGDVVAKGAFAESLRRIEAEGRVLPLLWDHASDDLGSYIGKVTSLKEDDHGLLFTATFDDTPEAQRARELAMDGRLCKFSFAYEVIDQMEVELEDGRKANELRELDIHEVSLVMYPANPDTSVVEVKGAPGMDAPTVATAFVDLVPRVKGLGEQQLKEFTAAIAEAANNGVEMGLKAGRRNSKADEDELRAVLAKLGECQDAIRALIGDDSEPEEGDDNDADDQGDTAEGGEGEATPKGREVEAAKVEAYRNAILNQKEGYHA